MVRFGLRPAVAVFAAAPLDPMNRSTSLADVPSMSAQPSFSGAALATQVPAPATFAQKVGAEPAWSAQ
jgi:hypothetical protein